MKRASEASWHPAATALSCSWQVPQALLEWADLIFANSRWAVLQIGLFSKFARDESADFILLTFQEASARHLRGRFLDRSKIPEAADEGESERDHRGEG